MIVGLTRRDCSHAIDNYSNDNESDYIEAQDNGR